jgi:hypothetical protein
LNRSTSYTNLFLAFAWIAIRGVFIMTPLAAVEWGIIILQL